MEKQGLNNKIILETSVNKFKASNEYSQLRDSDVFEIFSLLQITKDFDLSHSDIEDSILDGGLDGGIDSIIVLVNERYISTTEEIEDIVFNASTDVKIFISQVKYEKSFKETALDKLITSVPELLDLELDDTGLLKRFNPALVEKIILVRKIWIETASRGGSLDILFIYVSKANEIICNGAFEAKQKQLVDLTKNAISQENVEMILYSAKEILEMFQKPKSATYELKFKENPITVTFNTDEYGYMGVVALNDYYQFIVNDDGRIIEPIFESNVRHFQGSVDVNRKITTTIEKDFEVDFWWLNNGITIIASKSTTISKSIFLDNVQIVNGLQTSFLLGNNFDISNENDSRSILVKIVITENKETIDKIISASNSQTPVSASVLRATEAVQRNMELFFSGKGYWYDRRKNYYKNNGKPASRIFSIQGAAQCIASILLFEPSLARSSPTKLVKESKYYDNIFDDSRDFQVYLNCCLLHKLVHDFIKSGIKSEHKNIARNFSYHLARILAFVLTAKEKYTSGDLVVLDLKNFDENKTIKAFDLLLDILNEYVKDNPEQNVINIAKSKQFSEHITSSLARIS